ncbi:Tyrosine--tRNA ligase [compost metagenome]
MARFHGEEAAAGAHRAAGNRLKDGELPEDLPEVELVSAEPMSVAAVLNKAGLVKNAATARDMLNAGSVKVDGAVVDRDFVFVPGETHVCQAGKKAFARIAVLAE